MAQISPRLARTYFAEIAADSALPLDPDNLVHMVRLRQHGHVVIGDIAIRCYQHKSKWTYDERDIRRAAQVLAGVPLDRLGPVCLHRMFRGTTRICIRAVLPSGAPAPPAPPQPAATRE